MRVKKKVLGCLIGGAIGDALGYAVEFNMIEEIYHIFGEDGITEFQLTNGVAQISDDTQLTLFTAVGLLNAWANSDNLTSEEIVNFVRKAYQDWFQTQSTNFCIENSKKNSWLLNVEELYHNREPGHTCMKVMRNNQFGSVENPINFSKGCGGIMRIAPVGLYFDEEYSHEIVAKVAAELSALTHGHELGYIPSAMLVEIIHQITHQDLNIQEVIIASLENMKSYFANSEFITDFVELIHLAITLSENDELDVENIHKIGEGFVAEETLAIAIYCSLKYRNDFQKAIITAVNHNGDSDSTGSVTGNILGAYLGIDKIPSKYMDNLELLNIITEIANDLYVVQSDVEVKSELQKKYIVKM